MTKNGSQSTVRKDAGSLTPTQPPLPNILRMQFDRKRRSGGCHGNRILINTGPHEICWVASHPTP